MVKLTFPAGCELRYGTGVTVNIQPNGCLLVVSYTVLESYSEGGIMSVKVSDNTTEQVVHYNRNFLVS